MNLFLAYILGIPDVIFSGLIGAGIAILGTSLQSWLQRRYDSKQRGLEREMALRKDVYLPAAAAVTKFQRYLTSHLAVDPDYLDAEEVLKDVWGNLNQIKLIASIETIEALDELNVKFTELNSPLLKKAVAIRRSNMFREAHIASRQQVMERLTSIAEMLGTTQNSDAAQLQTFRREYEDLRAQASTLTIQISELNLEMSEARLSLNSDFALAVSELEMYVGRAFIFIRREMKFSVDEQRFLKSIEVSEKRIREISEELRSDFKTEFLAPLSDDRAAETRASSE